MKQIVNKIDLLKVAQVAVVAVMFLAPISALALNLPNCGAFGGFNCTNTGAGATLTGLITTVINWLLALAGLIAILFLVIGGFWYITSAGNEETAEKGKNTAINAIIGLVIIILSYVIVNVVANLVSSAGSPGGGNSGL